MAQSGVYAPGPVIDADVTIRVNGIVREHVSMDWAGDTTGGLPEQVVSAGTGMRSRTGSILWAQEDVQVEPPHPLRQSSGWPPREGDEVVIDATVDTGSGPYTYRRFTGRLGRTTGSLTDGTLTSQITDTLGDALETMVSIPPIMGAFQTRSSWVAWGAIEAAGLGLLTPWTDPGVVLAFHGQGGAAPLVGSGGAGTMFGSKYGYQWGGASFAPSVLSRPPGGFAATALARGGDETTATTIRLTTTAGVFTMRFTGATRALTFSKDGTQVWSGTMGDTGDAPLFAFSLSASGAQIYTSQTEFVTVVAGALQSGAHVTEFACTEGRIASMQVRYGAWGAGVAEVPRTPAKLHPSNLETVRLPATRGVENVKARAVVEAWSEATLASVWMDEHGVTQAVARDRLLSRPVSRALRVEERVLAGSWSVGDDQVRSGVAMRGLQGLVDQPGGAGSRALVYQEGSARSIKGTEVIERFIEAPAEMEWGPVDTTAQHAVDTTVADNLPSEGTWIWGVTTTDAYDSPEEWIWSPTYPGGVYDILIERLGQRTLKITETVTAPSGRNADLKAPDVDTSSELRQVYRNTPSPVIRGRWTSTWTDYTITGASTGPAWAPVLVHDAGWWLAPADAQRVADALSAEVTQAIPTFTGVTVLWDPTRQIGDVEEWIAVDKTGAESWRARVLVTGYSEGWDGHVPSQSVDVRVISMTDPTTGKTYGDLAAAYSTYAGLTGTYQQVYDALPAAR